MIQIYFAVEDDLSETVLRKILSERSTTYHISAVFKHNGYGYLKKNCAAFNNLAKNFPVLLLTDLDQNPCPSGLIHDWIPRPLNEKFLFRVAVREVEAWLLAHDQALKEFLGLRRKLNHPYPETFEDPKAKLLALVPCNP